MHKNKSLNLIFDIFDLYVTLICYGLRGDTNVWETRDSSALMKLWVKVKQCVQYHSFPKSVPPDHQSWQKMFQFHKSVPNSNKCTPNSFQCVSNSS